jgi:tetratricopeptide (TPR) repeat protein
MRSGIWLFLAVMVTGTLCASAMAQDMTAEDWYKKSEQYYNSSSLEESVQALDKALQIDPENATIWQTKGRILVFMNKNDEANNSFQMADQILNKSILRDPENINTLLSKSQVLQGMGKSDEAIETVDKAIALDPNNIDSRVVKADILVLAGRYNESIMAYDNAIELIPANDTKMRSEVIFGRGNSFSDAGRYSEAIEDYDQAIRLSPEFAPAWNNKGLALRKLGAPDEARELPYPKG